MLNQPEPDVPRAILRATSAIHRTRWEIEAGVVGSWHKLPKGKSRAFVAQYGGSPHDMLQRQRQAITQEIREKRGGKLRGPIGPKEPQVPQGVGEDSFFWDRSTHRIDIEQMMRSANFDASDLDEADMNSVVSAVMSAAAEAARLATASF